MPSVNKLSEGSIQTLPEGKGFQLDAEELPSAIVFEQKTSAGICELPPMPLLATARAAPMQTRNPDPGHTVETESIDRELARYNDEPELLLSIARAVRLLRAGLPEWAVAQYDLIRKRWPSASWTDAVTRDILVPPGMVRGSGGVESIRADQPLRTYALVIGISNYQNNIPNLKYAAADAKTFADFLESPRGGGLTLCSDTPSADCQLRLLTDKQATLAHVAGSFDSFIMQHASPANRLIVFIAAHGVYPKIEEGFKPGAAILRQPVILTSDSDYSDAKVTGYLMSELRDDAARAALAYGGVIVFADVCRAGNLYPSPEKSVGLQPAVAKALSSAQIGFLMASQGDKDSYESSKFGGGHGAFSYSVLDYLTSGSLPTRLTFVDVQSAVVKRVRDLTLKRQVPDIQPPHNGPETPIVYDTKQKTIPKLGKATPLTPDDTRRPKKTVPIGLRGPGPPQQPASSDDLISTGRLRSDEPASAWQELERLKNDPAIPPDLVEAYRERLRTALEDRGQTIMLKYLRGDQIEPRVEDFQQCAADFEAALELNPRSSFNRSRALFCRARAMMFGRLEKDYADAIDLLQQSIRLDATRSYAYNALGIAYLEQIKAPSDERLLPLAEAAFHDAIHYSPYWAYPWHNLALLLSERGNYAASVDCYRKAIELAPEYPYLPYNLGLLFQRTNRLKDAQAQYQQAYMDALNSRDYFVQVHGAGRLQEEAEALNALGTIMEKQSIQKAKDKYQQAIDANQEIISARHNLANLIALTEPSSNRPEELWKELLAKKSDYSPALAGFSRYLFNHGRFQEAAAEYEVLLKLADDSAAAHRGFGAVLAALGRPEDALFQYRHARNVLPEDAETLERLGDTFLVKGRKDDAREAYALAKTAFGEAGNRKAAKRLAAKRSEL
jgi:tetratricopeptide (TPR) repeat protein